MWKMKYTIDMTNSYFTQQCCKNERFRLNCFGDKSMDGMKGSNIH